MLRFSPRYGIVSPALVRPSRMRPLHAVNDNSRPGQAGRALGDETLEAALRLFAVHGLSAAERASAEAANACERGDIEQAVWWDEIVALLDRRHPGLRARRKGRP